MAAELSALSTCRHKHGAVLVNHGKVVGIGVNVLRNDPSRMSAEHIKLYAGIHAEDAAIRAASAASARGGVLYVARTNKRGARRLSKPCNKCAGLIEAAGIKRAVYTDA